MLGEVRAADQKDGLLSKNGPANDRHVRRRFAAAKDHLRKTAAPPPIHIHPRHSKIDKTRRVQLAGGAQVLKTSRIGIIFDSMNPWLRKNFCPSSFRRSVSRVMRRKSFFVA